MPLKPFTVALIAACVLASCARQDAPAAAAPVTTVAPWVTVSTVDAPLHLQQTVTQRTGVQVPLGCVQTVVAAASEENVQWLLWSAASGGTAVASPAPTGSAGVLEDLLNC